MSRFAVVICGGGVAGIEGLLRLHRLAGDRVEVTLLCSSDRFVYRPEVVLEPFGPDRARSYPIERIAADTGAQWVRESLSSVDRAACTVQTSTGRVIPYDALLLAVGGRERPPMRFVDVFTGGTAGRPTAASWLTLKLVASGISHSWIRSRRHGRYRSMNWRC